LQRNVFVANLSGIWQPSTQNTALTVKNTFCFLKKLALKGLKGDVLWYVIFAIMETFFLYFRAFVQNLNNPCSKTVV